MTIKINTKPASKEKSVRHACRSITLYRMPNPTFSRQIDDFNYFNALTSPSLSYLFTITTPELKLIITLRLPNKSSLRNIIRTSATFRDLYRRNDEAIYTAITIRSLAQRGFDVFSQVNALEFYVLKHTWSNSDIAGAVRILYSVCQQHESNHSRDTIVRCSVHVCTVALHILHAVAYDLPNVKSVGAARAIQRFQYRNMRDWSAMK